MKYGEHAGLLKRIPRNDIRQRIINITRANKLDKDAVRGLVELYDYLIKNQPKEISDLKSENYDLKVELEDVQVNNDELACEVTKLREENVVLQNQLDAFKNYDSAI